MKGALFARYSRTTKSLRRLFLDEFAAGRDARRAAASERRRANAPRSCTSASSWSTATTPSRSSAASISRASRRRSCWRRRSSGAASPPTSSSPRATCATTTGRGGRWRATVPPEIEGTQLEERYVGAARRGVRDVRADVRPARAPGSGSASRRSRGDSDFVYRQTIMAKTCDTLRMLLPAGTRSNLGIYATGQSYEQLLMRLAQHPLAEMRDYGAADAGRAPQGDPGVPQARRRAGARRRLEPLLARRPRAHGGARRRKLARRRRRRAAREVNVG